MSGILEAIGDQKSGKCRNCQGKPFLVNLHILHTAVCSSVVVAYKFSQCIAWCYCTVITVIIFYYYIVSMEYVGNCSEGKSAAESEGNVGISQCLKAGHPDYSRSP